jgi:hypothetical protein
MALIFKVDTPPDDWINRIPSTDQVLFIDQRLEGWPISEYYDKLHSKLLDPSKVIFATSNLKEEELYSHYVADKKLKIVSSLFFATRHRQLLPASLHLDYKQNNNIKLFSCLNRVYRNHRKALVLMLHDRDLLKHGEVSHNTFTYINFPDYKEHKSFRQENIDALATKLPLTIDQQDFDVNWADDFFKETYLRTWVSVVTETFFSEYNNQSMFFSEKIFKPIRAHHPFILAAAPGSLTALKNLGFKTFDNWWDESYDNIVDPVDRLEAICDLIEELSTWSKERWLKVYSEIQPNLIENSTLLLRTNWNAQFDQLITI